MGLSIFLCFTLAAPGLAQDIRIKKSIDSIYKNVIPALNNSGNFEEAVAKSIEIVNIAQKIKYKEAVAKAYLSISNSLSQLGKYRESIRYLDLAQSRSNDVPNKSFDLRVTEGYARSYMGLKLNKKSIELYTRALYLYHKNNLQNPNLLAFLYKNKAAVLDNDHQIDSSLYYLRKAFKIRKTTFDYISMAYHQLGTLKNLDSAEYYLNSARQQMLLNPPSKYEQVILNINFGKLYKSREQYGAALEHFEKAAIIAKETKLINKLVVAYQLIEETYDKVGNTEQSYEYLSLYTHLQDSISNERNKGFNLLVDRFLEEKENEYQKSRNKMFYLISGIVLIGLIILSFIYYSFHKKRKERIKLVREKERESKVLKSKINESFNEVVELAIENSPNFLTRFQEVYPELIKKLLALNPNLVNTELTLCAMIYLNFSSKEIAKYTFVQPKTVQVKKYRLRKKLDIPKNADIYNWIKNL